MSASICKYDLIGKCRRGAECPKRHVRVMDELAVMRARVYTTVMVQRAWPNKRTESRRAWQVMISMLGSARPSDRLTVVAYDATLESIVNGETCAWQPALQRVQDAFMAPHQRVIPDCFMQCLAATLSLVCMRAQHAERIACHQVVIFTYTGAIGDYSDVRGWTSLLAVMRAVQLRVVIVGIALRERERQSLDRLRAISDLFVYYDGTMPHVNAHRNGQRLARLADKMHIHAVVNAHYQRGGDVSWWPAANKCEVVAQQ